MGTTWPGLLPAILLAAGLLLLPGGLVLRALGLRGTDALLLAPTASIGVVVLAGTIVGGVGADWTLGTGLVALLLTTLAAMVLGAAVVRGRPRRRAPLTWPVAVGIGVVGTVLAWLVLARSVDAPASLPQMPDLVFHLGAPEWMVRHGSASILDVHRYAGFDGVLSYPGGLHVLLAVLAEWTGMPVIVVAHALLVVVMGWVWPLSAVALARVVLAPGRGVAVATGLLALLFSSFPFRFLAWGPLWPNLLSMALFPAVVAAALSAVAPRELLAGLPLPTIASRWYAVPALLVLGACQPNAIVTGVVLAGALAWWAIPSWRRRRSGRWVRRLLSRPVFALALVAVVLGWRPFIPANMFVVNWQVSVGWGTALHDLGTFVDGSPAGAVLLGLLVLVGTVVLARARSTRWIVAFLLVLATLFTVLYAVNGEWIRRITWLWWNDQVRLRAMTVLPALLAAVAACRWIAGHVARWTRTDGKSRWTAVVAAAVALALAGGLSTSGTALQVTYHETSSSWSWLRPSEQAALVELATHVPAGVVVAANPWRGGMFLYPLTGVELLYPTNFSLTLPDRRVLGTGLDRIATNPEVCAAARRQRVGYVITGGDSHLWGYYDNPDYAGIDATVLNGAFTPIAAAGPYVLRAVPACPG